MGPICLGANESHIYPNMCAIFGYGPTVVSREKGGTDTLTAGMNGYRITSMAAAPPSGWLSRNPHYAEVCGMDLPTDFQNH